jgi:hypothetical protein
MFKLFSKNLSVKIENDGSGVAVKILFRYGMVRYSFFQSAINIAYSANASHSLVRYTA